MSVTWIDNKAFHGWRVARTVTPGGKKIQKYFGVGRDSTVKLKQETYKVAEELDRKIKKEYEQENKKFEHQIKPKTRSNTTGVRGITLRIEHANRRGKNYAWVYWYVSIKPLPHKKNVVYRVKFDENNPMEGWLNACQIISNMKKLPLEKLIQLYPSVTVLKMKSRIKKLKREKSTKPTSANHK